MNITERHLDAIVRAVDIHAMGRWSWFNARMDGRSHRGSVEESEADARLATVEQIKQVLYTRFYVRGRVVNDDRADQAHALESGPDIGDLIAREIGPNESWSSAWRLIAVSGKEAILRRGGLSVSTPVSFLRIPLNSAPVVGEFVEVRMPALARNLSPGFVFIRGKTDLDDAAKGVRLYWHLRPGAELAYFKNAYALLNQAELPFRFKISSNLRALSRCDAAVLYVRADDWAILQKELPKLYCAMADRLKAGTPALTLELAPGLGLAEDPPNGASFGETRCASIAEALVGAYEEKLCHLPARVEFVSKFLQKQGLNLERPHLNPGSDGKYLLRCVSPVPRTATHTEQPPQTSANKKTPDFLTVAGDIGLAIVDRAWWSDDRCTWIAGCPTGSDEGRRPRPAMDTTLDFDLYSGLAGVALFLAELSATQGDEPAFCRTAQAAIKQARRLFDRKEAGDRHSLHSGGLGLALVAARMGRLLGDNELRDYAHQLAKGAAEGLRQASEFDVLAGKAGGILSLLAMRQQCRDADFVAPAIALGDELIRDAVQRAGTLSWRGGSETKETPLTGYSHGASGAAHAFCELFAETGLPRFRSAALQAIAYERSCFDANCQGWPDFRREPGQPRQKKGDYPCITLWCHGAAGILISRVRCWQVLGDSGCRDDSVIAAKITRE